MNTTKPLRSSLRLSTLVGGAALCALSISGCSEDKPGQCNPHVDPNCNNDGIVIPGVPGGNGTGTQSGGPVLPGGGGQGTGGGNSQDEVCEVEEVPAKIQAANVMLVLDKSGSMSQNRWRDHNVDRTRWESLYKTVEFMVGQFNNSVRFGMKLFPAKDATATDAACKMDPGVDVPIGDANGAAIMAALPKASDVVQGGTPAVSGHASAVEYLKSVAAGGDTRRRIIILVMDGRVADCNEKHMDLVNTATKARKEGISTFVVGIDVDPKTPEGFDLHGDLKVLASEGGTETYYDSSDPQRLRTAMEEIVSKISDCRVPLGKLPLQPGWATVEVGGGTFRWLGTGVPSCDAANLGPGAGGFTYTKMPTGQDAIELCGQACTNYINTGNVKVNILCEPPK